MVGTNCDPTKPNCKRTTTTPSSPNNGSSEEDSVDDMNVRLQNTSLLKRVARDSRPHTVLETEEGAIDLDVEYGEAEVDENLLPKYHRLNKRLWKKRKTVIALFVLGIIAWFMISCCIVFCGKMCGDMCRVMNRLLCTYIDKIRCRDANYRYFAEQFERFGYEPPPYEHYLHLKDAFGFTGNFS